jgi:hypothetical protein
VERTGGRCGKGGGSVHGLLSFIVLLCLCVIVSLQRVWERGVHCERGTGNAIPFRCPGAEVSQLTSFRAKGAPGIAFPDAGLVAEGADHARHYTMLSLKISQEPTRADPNVSRRLVTEVAEPFRSWPKRL